MSQQHFDLKLNENGRIVIPAGLRQECGLKAGDSLKISYIDGKLVISSPQMALRYLQQLVKEHCSDTDMVEELFKMRREEFAQEERELAEKS